MVFPMEFHIMSPSPHPLPGALPVSQATRESREAREAREDGTALP